MTSLLVATTAGAPQAAGLPVARFADPDECATPLVVDVDRCGDTAVVRARGEVDILTVPRLRSALDRWLSAGVGTVVVDLRDVSFIDCAGVGELADARRRARDVRLEILPGRAVSRLAALLDLTTELDLPV